MPTRVDDSTVLDPSRAASPAVLLISGFLFFSEGDLWGLPSYGPYLQGDKEVTVGLYKNLRGLARQMVLIGPYHVGPSGLKRST